ncbi:MAG: hypothetical protein MRZ32_06165 [Bacteroidales bacterium]|nr:hypothetical protein [Bacteroidales bacterium]MDY2916596.1 hypothetical protein [Muribaculaceae bacterium]
MGKSFFTSAKVQKKRVTRIVLSVKNEEKRGPERAFGAAGANARRRGCKKAHKNALVIAFLTKKH